MKYSDDFIKNMELTEERIGFGKNFDCKKRIIDISGRQAAFYFISTMSSDAVIGDLIYRYQHPCCSPGVTVPIETFAAGFVPYGDISLSDDPDNVALFILSGVSALIIEGYNRAILTDTRSVPVRSISEPDNDRVLRGSRDGFTELLKNNIAILRRRIRCRELTINKVTVGRSSQTDVAVCYYEGRADADFVKRITDRISSIQTDALSLGQESLAECLIRQKWFNPFPKFRYTERPDTATATLLEGGVIVMCDNSPQAMLLPTSIFDFVQESDDYYFPPLTGTYLRFVRTLIFFVTLFFSPAWYMLVIHPELVPPALDFIKINNDPAIPIFFQLMIVELMIDGLKLASLNTPSTLGNSLSVVAGLIMGDFAVEVGWLIPEVILYMSFVAISNFTQPSFELGYAFKFMRIMMLCFVALLGWAGFIVGTVLIVVIVASNKSVDGSRSYLYPLIPFNKKAMSKHIIRKKLRDWSDNSDDPGKSDSGSGNSDSSYGNSYKK